MSVEKMTPTITVHPFDPIANSHSKVLILGSFPSIVSTEKGFYYAHPRNQFWPIMEMLFDVHLRSDEAKKRFSLEKGMALWDVFGALARTQNNSSDSNLGSVEPNDIEGLLVKCPHIKTVFCTGRKSYDAMKKFFPSLKAELILLPSTSPAYAAMSFKKKLEAYEIIKDKVEAQD